MKFRVRQTRVRILLCHSTCFVLLSYSVSRKLSFPISKIGRIIVAVIFFKITQGGVRKECGPAQTLGKCYLLEIFPIFAGACAV